MIEEERKQTGQDMSKEKPEGIIDMKEAIELLSTTRSTFYRWLREGKVKGMKAGRQWRFYREDIERFLRGEEPRIELPADIEPLIVNLRGHAEQLGMETTMPGKTDLQPVVEAVDLMILLADGMNASDIHLAPHVKEDGSGSTAILRYRVDGVLHIAAEIDPRLLPAIIDRWKTISACDVNERRRPQDGRLLPELHGNRIEMRVSFLPSGMGESLTVRILGRMLGSSAWLSQLKLDRIGFAPRDKEKILRCIESPWGMIVVSGPTGSGKTTVLYACLSHVARPELKVITVESPVEVFLPWAVQVQVQPDLGLTFAAAVRAILRSDPDVIMIGEIRDAETLKAAQECALTGHLVMTQMHTSDAPGVLRRMVELGCDPYIVGESTKLVIGQRLVRKLCPECSIKYNPPAEVLDRVAEIARTGRLDWDSLPKEFRESVGCPNCKATGYKGRTIIAEALEVTTEIIKALERDVSAEGLRSIAVEQGMNPMITHGISRAAVGETSIAEVMRVAG